MVEHLCEKRRVLTAMREWRHQIAQDGYAGLKKPDVGYSLASVMDEMALGWRDQPENIRRAVLRFVEMVERERDARQQAGS